MTIIVPWWLALVIALWMLVVTIERVTWLVEGWRDRRPGGDGED